MSSIVKDTPIPVTQINGALPSELSRIIKHCLVKNPAGRYQTAADLRNELAELKEEVDSDALSASRTSPTGDPTSRARHLWLFAAAIIVIGLAAAAYRWRPFSTAVVRAPGSRQRTFTQLTTLAGLEQFPALSPDGK